MCLTMCQQDPCITIHILWQYTHFYSISLPKSSPLLYKVSLSMSLFYCLKNWTCTQVWPTLKPSHYTRGPQVPDPAPWALEKRGCPCGLPGLILRTGSTCRELWHWNSPFEALRPRLNSLFWKRYLTKAASDNTRKNEKTDYWEDSNLKAFSMC